LTNETLKKMADDIPKVTEDILPGQKLDCVAYGCTSGTIAAGFKTILEKVNLVKPKTKVTTPITSAINAFKVLKVNKISIFTPYTDEINQSLINYFKSENIEISNLSYLDIPSDLDIGKIDPNYLFETLVNIDLSKSDALFISCTALPVLSLIKDIEKKIGKIILSSNQVLIWDTLKHINFKNKILNYGELFNN
jgi:maleate isomerase